VSIDLSNKWALVTGSSRGVGREIARGLSKLGCKLLLQARSLEHLKAIVEELGSTGTVKTIIADLSVESDVDRLVREALELSGGVDVLYNNAAMMTPARENYLEVGAEDFRRCFEVNFVAPVRITHGLLPSMLEKRFGRIVQLTSGIRDQPELMAYAASKAALDKFVRDTAPRLRQTGVTMNLLDPGWLRTDMGGPNAPNPVESVMPGALVPALLDGEIHGVWFNAQDYRGET
jgi:NAD(P)-dependent dehydrogenase (short-subunit alcohol dehydrogenase family)